VGRLIGVITVMYDNKLVCALKVDGKVLREIKDTVYLPFNSEYTILLKNLNTVKCLVSLELDGRDVGGGNKFIIQPGQSLEVERFIANGNLKEGNRFKFIERTGKIEEHRGIKVEDGLLRIKFQFEMNIPQFNHIYDSWHTLRSRDIGRMYSKGVSNDIIGSNISCSVNSAYSATPINDVGITVEGSKSSQQFSAGHIGALDAQEYVMVMKLLGDTGQGLVKEAVTVKRKNICKTCGTKNSSKLKFCGECGTALEII
jgi:hypothetical protein